MRHRARGAWFTLTLMFLLAACGGDGGTDPPVVTVSLSPGSVSLFVGETASLSANVSGAQGSTVSYSSSSPTVATVSAGGLVSAVGLGAATITASVAGASATSRVTVTPSTIEVSPTTVEVEAGSSAQLSATVTGGSGHVIEWTSSNPAVATVDGSGLVSGLAEGVVTVTAGIAGQPGAEATSEVAVVPLPTVTIDAVTQNGIPIDPADVSGVFTVETTVDASSSFTGTLQVQLDGVVIGTADVPAIGGAPSSGEGTLALRAPRLVDINSTTTGTTVLGEDLVARIPNARRTLDVLLLTRGAVERSRAMFDEPITLNNDPVVAIDEVSFDGATFPDPMGFDWGNGSLTFRATTVTYDGSTVESIGMGIRMEPSGLEFDLPGIPLPADGRSVTVTVDGLAAPPLGIGGTEGEITFPSATITPAGGATIGIGIANNRPDLYPEFQANLWWGDNRGPTGQVPLQTDASFYVNDRWNLNDHWSFNIGFRFEADANGPATVTDGGVGGVVCEWQAGTTLGEFPIRPVVTGADLPETGGFELFLRAKCEDRFMNVSGIVLVNPLGTPIPLGTDFTLPLLTREDGAGLLAEREINPAVGTLYGFGLVDPAPLGGSSGPIEDFIFVSAERNFRGATDEIRCATGTFENESGECVPEFRELPTNGRLEVPAEWAGDGLWTVTLQGKDGADNRSNVLKEIFIRDGEDPTFGGPVDGPSTLVGGTPATFGVDVQDNLNVWRAQGGVEFSGLDMRIGADPQVFGDPFDPVFNENVRATATFDFIPSLEAVGAGLPAPTGNVLPADEVYFSAQDGAWRLNGTVNFLSGVTPRPTSFGSGGLDWWRVSLSVAVLCDPDGAQDCGGAPAASMFEIEARIPDNGNDFPFSAVQLLAVTTGIDGVDIAIPMGEPMTSRIVDNGTWFQQFWTTTLGFVDVPLCTKGLIAIAFDENNSGLVSGSTPFRAITDTQAFATCP